MRQKLAALVACVLAAPGTAQEAGCGAELSRLSELLIEIDLIEEPISGVAETAADGSCHVAAPVLSAGPVFTVRADAMIWAGEGRDRFVLESLPPVTLALDIDGLRFAPDIGDPVMTYLLEVQNRGQSADVSLRAGWDAEARALEVERAEVVFPSGDYIRFSAFVEEVDLTDWTTIQMSAGSFGITRTLWEIRSFGLFENLAVMPLGLALLSGAEDPEARVEELKRVALAEIADLPEEIFPAASKSALAALVTDMPTPSGTLRVEMTADPGLGVARAMPLAMSRQGIDGLEQVWPLLEGVRYIIWYERG